MVTHSAGSGSLFKIWIMTRFAYPEKLKENVGKP